MWVRVWVADRYVTGTCPKCRYKVRCVRECGRVGFCVRGFASVGGGVIVGAGVGEGGGRERECGYRCYCACARLHEYASVCASGLAGIGGKGNGMV